MAQRILRPLEYGDLFDELFDIYKHNFALLVGIAGIAYIPLNTIMMRWLFGSGLMKLPGIKPETTNHVPDAVLIQRLIFFFGGLAVVGVLGLLMYALVQAAMTWAISRRYLGEPATIIGSFRAVGKKALTLSLMILLALLIFYIGLILCILPGLVIGVLFVFWFAFVVQVYVLEGMSMRNALARSRALAAGNWLRIFVVYLLVAIIANVVQRVIMLPFQLVIPGVGNPYLGASSSAATAYGVVTGVAGALTAPLSVLAFTLLYYDIRVRREGFDIEMLARNMGESTPVTGPDTTIMQ